MSEPNETDPSPKSERPALSGSAVIFLRLLLLVVATGAVFVAIGVAFRGRSEGDSGARYSCPMHPEVRTTAPGACPICQMALEPLVHDASGRGNGHGGMAMPDMTAIENVRKHKIIDFVRARALLPNLREMRGPAWVTSEPGDHGEREISAILYNDQIAALAPDEPGWFTPTATPSITVAVTRVPGPAVRWDSSTSLIHFRVGQTAAGASTAARAGALPTSNGPLPRGQVGWLKLASKARAVVGVPAAAVLQSPEGPYVLAWAGGQRFEKRRIEVGETFARQGFAVVLAGLRASDRVVSRATFFLDADRRLGAGTGDAPAGGMPAGMPGGAPQ